MLAGFKHKPEDIAHASKKVSKFNTPSPRVSFSESPEFLNPKPENPDPEPPTLNPQLETLNPKVHTLNPNCVLLFFLLDSICPASLSPDVGKGRGGGDGPHLLRAHIRARGKCDVGRVLWMSRYRASSERL